MNINLKQFEFRPYGGVESIPEIQSGQVAGPSQDTHQSVTLREGGSRSL